MGFDSSGTLTVTLDGNVIKNGFFAEGVILLDKCFRDLQTMTLSNPSRDDWTGSIIIKAAGKSTMISCKGCTGDSYFERITVDGTDDDSGHADTQCPIGNNCSISWIQTGIIDCRHSFDTVIPVSTAMVYMPKSKRGIHLNFIFVTANTA